jgi:tripartite-type tricarboxylate transporter receptor subunit TctC
MTGDMGIVRRTFVKGALASTAALLAPHVSRAQDWPNRPVRFIVHLAAGGGLDFIARLVGEHLSRTLGQQVFIENRTGGAGGTIGIDAGIKSPPDGYNFLIANDNIASAPHVLRLGVDYLKDVMPVSLLGKQPQVIVVHPSFEVNSLAEMVAAVKKQPGMGCATSGVGSNQHVLLEWFNKVAGIKLDHVPYRGAGQAINDLVAGHVKIGFLGPTAPLPHVRAGKLKLLAQSGEGRSPSMTETATLQESGYQNVSLESWFAVFAPLGTPPAVIAQLNAACDKALADQVVKDRLFQAATEPVGGDSERLAKLTRADSEKYARIVREVNIKTE